MKWTRPLTVADLGDDPDLRGLDPHWVIEIRMLQTPRLDISAVDDSMQCYTLAKVYADHGPWGLPPIVMMEGTDFQITGAHRLIAAGIAELPEIPVAIIRQVYA